MRTSRHSATSGRNQFRCMIVGLVGFWIALLMYITNVWPGSDAINSSDNSSNTAGNSWLTQKKEYLHSHSKPSFWGDETANIQEHIDNNIDEKYRDFCANIMLSDSIGQKDIWSQGFQEWYLYHNFFLGKFGSNGVYLDVGSHKPTHLSNTAFFDICLGWHGICVEPTDTALEFEGIRSCRMARHCVWKETTNLIMIFRSDGDASMIIDKKEQDRIKREVPDRVKDLFECDAISATDLMDRYKPTNRFGSQIDISKQNGKKVDIDLISLDVEGAEIEYLRCFPWDDYDVKVWTIEVNKGEGHIDEMMLAHGYVKYDYLSFFHSRLDAVYVKKPNDVKQPWGTEHEFLQWKRFQRCDVETK